jgi:RNA polymerase I-specific transcription initiation factor RRN3
MAPISTHLPSAKKQRPGKPLLRRNVLVGSVRSCEESIPASPAKRARTVTFNPNVEEQIYSSTVGLDMEDQEVDVESVRIEVRSAIEEHTRGESEERYEGLKTIFVSERRTKDLDGECASSEKIQANLLALTSCAYLLGKSCSGLVKAILECDWIGRDEGFVKVYVHFLGNLASARGAYVGSVLSMLTEKFTNRK